MEAVITIDVLLRAEINVIVASLNNSGIVECSQAVNIKADKDLSTVKDQLFDVVILPGGLNCMELKYGDMLLSVHISKIIKVQKKLVRMISRKDVRN